jgi:hypothetical protein
MHQFGTRPSTLSKHKKGDELVPIPEESQLFNLEGYLQSQLYEPPLVRHARGWVYTFLPFDRKGRQASEISRIRKVRLNVVVGVVQQVVELTTELKMDALSHREFFAGRKVDVVRARSTEGVAVCHVRREVAILPRRNQVSRSIRNHIARRQLARPHQRICVRVRPGQIEVCKRVRCTQRSCGAGAASKSERRRRHIS